MMLGKPAKQDGLATMGNPVETALEAEMQLVPKAVRKAGRELADGENSRGERLDPSKKRPANSREYVMIRIIK
jgi:hypothetical protein